MPGEAGADSGAHGRDFILSLESFHSIILVTRQFVQNIGSGRDGIRTIEQRPSGQLGRRHKSDGRGFVAGDFAITARRDDGLLNRVVGREDFSSFGKIVTCLKSDFVRFDQLRVLFELRTDPAQGCIERAIVEPVQNTERKKILAAIDLFAGKLHVTLQSVPVEGRDGQLMYPIPG